MKVQLGQIQMHNGVNQIANDRIYVLLKTQALCTFYFILEHYAQLDMRASCHINATMISTVFGAYTLVIILLGVTGHETHPFAKPRHWEHRSSTRFCKIAY